MLSDVKETKFGGGNQEVTPLAGKKNRVVLVSWPPWKSVPTAISGSVDFSEFPGCHLLHQMNSQWGSQKTLQGLLSHFLSVFDPFFNSWNDHIQKDVNQIILHHSILRNLGLPIIEVFIWFLLNVNLSSSQTLLTFLLFMRQTQITQLILAISLFGIIFLLMFLQCMWRKDFLLHRNYFQKNLHILTFVYNWLYLI